MNQETMGKEVNNQHALLSPSASHRWLHCTASAQLEAERPNTDTDYTKEGTLAHAYCAKSLKLMIGEPHTGEDKEIEALKEYANNEMLGHVETYASIVGEKFTKATLKVSDSLLIVETKLDFSQWIPGGFGTADAIIITDGTLEVIDFKYGKGVEVSAHRNSQMMIYALGAVAKYEDEYNIQRVRMTIVQPRLANLSEYEMDVNELKQWAEAILVPRAKEATGNQCDQRHQCGDWCRFCRVKDTCVTLAGECLAVADRYASDTITNEDMALNILPKLAAIKAWATAMEESALAKALQGEKFTGYKLVEGRSIRKVTDPGELAKKLLEKGFSSDKVFKPMELETLTNLEKLVGKKDFAVIAEGLIEKPQGKPTLVPESDKRPALNQIENDFKDF